MATVRTTTSETRIHFELQSADGTGTVNRYISLPGIDEYSADNFPAFRNYILQNMNQFVQPSNWRDSTGSSISEDDSPEPYTTVDVKLEYYTVEKIINDGLN